MVSAATFVATISCAKILSIPLSGAARFKVIPETYRDIYRCGVHYFDSAADKVRKIRVHGEIILSEVAEAGPFEPLDESVPASAVKDRRHRTERRRVRRD
jgi:hypothetical protein